MAYYRNNVPISKNKKKPPQQIQTHHLSSNNIKNAEKTPKRPSLRRQLSAQNRCTESMKKTKIKGNQTTAAHKRQYS